MAVGLNAIREICARAPLAMTTDLLQDLVQYKTTKNKTVMMAARSLMQLYRNVDSSKLHKKDRGKIPLFFFFHMFPFDPSDNNGKPNIFWCFQGGSKGDIVKSRVKQTNKFRITLWLTHFVVYVPILYTLWKHQKTFVFLEFLGGIKWEYRLEMD